MDIGMHFGKFLTGSLISALLAIGGVWFVVDLSLRGLESSIQVTNQRISSLEANLLNRIELSEINLKDRLDSIKSNIDQQFNVTRGDIKKASILEPVIRDSTGKEMTVALRANFRDLNEIVESSPSLNSWADKFKIAFPEADNDVFFYTFAASPNWEWAADLESGQVDFDKLMASTRMGFTTAEAMIASGCVSQAVKNDGTIQLLPVAESSLAARNGVICYADNADEANEFIKLSKEYQ
ncbi:hypothetical protein PZ897_16865 [Hoeflea sp. YIM 152468]|uniref:hypothetical protein n=1 Tax=Hoeflea sp. YIM 152468 TaxID=3031759 RepID=UPI0023DBACCB|nr:hypothetical protein [Hoeflea sp. YIM 152468]MDF1609860.1 hypothetical protein [Hoeflea sp. YIM 152468]